MSLPTSLLGPDGLTHHFATLPAERLSDLALRALATSNFAYVIDLQFDSATSDPTGGASTG